MNNLINNLIIQNPKRESKAFTGRASIYPYYASFSPSFTHTILTSRKLPKEAMIVDPWNGSGTTTTAAAKLGYRTQGYDLNPVMVIAAKASMLNIRDKTSLWPIAVDIMGKALKDKLTVANDDDPLCVWMMPDSVKIIRRIEKALQALLVDSNDYKTLVIRSDFSTLSDIAAFFYTALFRCIRGLVNDFISSNPTWIKKPKDLSLRLQPNRELIVNKFGIEVQKMIKAIESEDDNSQSFLGKASIEVASSEALPIPNESADFILSSPPYCTRIDYAVATMPELALLGYELDNNFQNLRRKLIGTSTVQSMSITPIPSWGETCNLFLQELIAHESKASKTYYYKNHTQYFNAIHTSFSELSRILRSEGLCILVVQDSYYKDLHNDLPQIFIEMAGSHKLQLERRANFNKTKTMVDINSRSIKYRKARLMTESVLCFSKI